LVKFGPGKLYWQWKGSDKWHKVCDVPWFTMEGIVFKFELGKKVRNKVTMVVGTITARCEYLSSPPRYQVEGVDKNDRPIENWYFEGDLDPMA